MTSEYVVLVLLWVTYFFIHSFMISSRFTYFLKLKFKSKFQFYRLFYNTLAIITLLPVVWYTYKLDSETLFSWSNHFRIFQFSFIIIIGYITLLALKEYDLLHLAGFRQIEKKNTPKVNLQGSKLKDSGILGLVRHPIYAICFPLIWLHDISITSIIVNIIVSLYLIIGTRLEEKKMILEFGDQYRNYQKKVSMFFPWKWIFRKLKSISLK